MSKPLVIDGPEWGVRGLLSCGHYDSPVHERSSVWDFPEEERTCPECGEERQFDPELQAAIHASWREELDESD